MAHKVYMPVLGMNQDTGIIAAWRKNTGDAVAVGDVMLDIETDKAVQEIEAQQAGFMSNILFPEGAEIPVGEVIAYIVDSADEVTHSDSATDTSATSAIEGVTESATHTDATSASTTGTNKILASPKAKVLAVEKHLGLASVVASGVAQPIHARDVLVFDAQRPKLPQPHEGVRRYITVNAQVAIADYEKLQQQVTASGLPHTGVVLTAFAKAAYEEHTSMHAQHIAVVDGENGNCTTYAMINARDFATLSAIDEPVETDITLLLLEGTSITQVSGYITSNMQVSVCAHQKHVTITTQLLHTIGSMTDCIRITQGLADRIANPLNHLL